ncbi:MAG TPA: sulfotransferase, partial [Solirubrobacteraceae bacterium]|nr:sulfotransferase [Solirubrobacteraceae bacterium]
FMPNLKEPLFFSSDMGLRFATPRSGKVPQTLDAYLALFADGGQQQRWGEASSSYLWSRTAAAAIAQLQPQARIIAVLREPASFLQSLHLQLMQIHVESQGSFRKALALEPARREGKRIPRRSHRPQLLLYSEHVRYVEQLRRYEAVFPPEQLLVLIYDDFRADNEATVRKILRFLELDDSAPVKVTDANPTVVVRSPRLHEISQAVALGQSPLSRALNRTVKAFGPRNVRRAVAIRERLLMGSPGTSDEGLVLELRRRLKSEVLALSQHLDRDLVTLWGYDRID